MPIYRRDVDSRCEQQISLAMIRRYLSTATASSHPVAFKTAATTTTTESSRLQAYRTSMHAGTRIVRPYTQTYSDAGLGVRRQGPAGAGGTQREHAAPTAASHDMRRGRRNLHGIAALLLAALPGVSCAPLKLERQLEACMLRFLCRPPRTRNACVREHSAPRRCSLLDVLSHACRAPAWGCAGLAIRTVVSPHAASAAPALWWCMPAPPRLQPSPVGAAPHACAAGRVWGGQAAAAHAGGGHGGAA